MLGEPKRSLVRIGAVSVGTEVRKIDEPAKIVSDSGFKIVQHTRLRTE